MMNAELLVEDVEAVVGGQQKILPFPGGGWCVLSYAGGVYRLTPIKHSVKIEVGVTPREGAVTETPPKTSQ